MELTVIIVSSAWTFSLWKIDVCHIICERTLFDLHKLNPVTGVSNCVKTQCVRYWRQ